MGTRKTPQRLPGKSQQAKISKAQIKMFIYTNQPRQRLLCGPILYRAYPTKGGVSPFWLPNCDNLFDYLLYA